METFEDNPVQFEIRRSEDKDFIPLDKVLFEPFKDNIADDERYEGHFSFSYRSLRDWELEWTKLL